jgi:hypothetical protein
MNEARPASIIVTCPSCKGIDFQVRPLRAEGLATLKCVGCIRDYLLLDSDEYWFDVIQRGYPRLSKCRCGSSSFAVKCSYSYRGSGDVRSIEVTTICSACADNRFVMDVEISYAGTEELFVRPLKYCKNPKIFYDLKELTLYAKRADIARVVDYLGNSCGCSFVCWFRLDNAWVKRHISAEVAKAIVTQDNGPLRADPYLRIYAHKSAIEISDEDVNDIKKEDRFWKTNEVIKLGSPVHMGMGEKQALLYYVHFSNEVVNGERIARKSPGFVTITEGLLGWLRTEFVSWRGPLAFDNPDEHIRIFGDRFTKRKQS